MTKTEHYLKLLLAINESSSGKVSETWLKEFFGNPPKATWHRYIHDLTQGFGEIPALLVKFTHDEGTSYRLNSSSWTNVTEGDEESYFLWEALNKVGFLYSPLIGKTELMDDDSRAKLKNLDRKFVYVGQSRPRDIDLLNKKLSPIICAVMEQKEINIKYDNENRKVRPLGIIQYKDDLYLACFRINTKQVWEKRTYKVARIQNVENLDKTFPYPDRHEWNPKDELEKQSGLVQGKRMFVQIEVFGSSRKTFSEKIIFGSEFLEKRLESDVYQMQYSNPEELLSILMGYIQDIRIINCTEIEDLIDQKIHTYIKINQKREKIA